ncbi:MULTISPECIES: hypothetical protein [Streptomyces]|uniref:Secreted protein n=1 Tax=Streptomyces tricolor TaxID=68277 RepID=A0ABS9JWF9_9ACTN|nr:MULTISPECIES: hypothetical protein [Streptomyces]MCG0069898.1 hypothetical protein [Streptomyces tricolor]BCM70313.1 hypothetical protein EASAB2608_05647 [Streptomyces sp. EAS-AB2608]
MRRIGTALAALAAALLVLAAPGPALAAEGILVINGVEHDNPRGCFGIPQPSFVVNDTDTPVLVHAGPDCRGPFVDVVEPGRAKPVRPGGSVSVR